MATPGGKEQRVPLLWVLGYGSPPRSASSTGNTYVGSERRSRDLRSAPHGVPPPWKVATCTPRPALSPSPGGRRLRSLMHVCAGQGPPEERTDRMCVRWGDVMDIVQWLRSPTICIGELGPSGANGRPSPRAREPGH